MNNIVVIGGGPGGYVAAIRAAQLGGNVTLIEKEHIGGTCLNEGCIPTKVLLHAAEVQHDLKEAALLYSSNPEDVIFSWDKVLNKKRTVVSGLVGGVSSLLKANRIKIINGTASFVTSKKLKIVHCDASQTEIVADKIIIASGSVPAVPSIPGVKENELCITSTEALSLKQIPTSMVIIGGGVIGVELATVYSAFGTKVTIVEALSNILPAMDSELVNMLRKTMEKGKIRILTNSKVLSVEEFNGAAKVNIDINGETQTVEAEKVLIAVGRRVNTDELNLNEIGIEQDRGRICVNEKMETNIPSIYAIGDCVGQIMLAHTASAQGEVAAENAMGQNKIYNQQTAASCVYCNPELAGVGITQEKADLDGIDYVVGKFSLAANGKAIIENGGRGLVKLIFQKDSRKLIGAHILGPRATDIISECALALKMETTIDDFISTIHPHPTVSEAIREAALAADKRAIHSIN